MNRRTTSHDVARLAGVSQSTVSLVLNGREDIRIPDATRQRVMAAARQLNYARNAAAHALLTGRTGRIGVVPIHPRAFLYQGAYYGALMTSFIEGALRHGRNLLLHSAEYAEWELLYRDILGRSADGVLLIGRPLEDPLTLALLEAKFPTVCISYQPIFPVTPNPEHSTPDAQTPAPLFYSVDCDNELGGYLITQHLLNLGHRRIGYFGPDPQYSWQQQRWTGAQLAVSRAGLPPETLRLLNWNDTHPPAELLNAVQQLLANERPTALVSRDEGEAERIIALLAANDLHVPHDVALACFNSTDISERAQPPLTSVWQPLDQIGAAAVDLLVDLIDGKDIAPEPNSFRCAWIFANLVARLPHPNPSPDRSFLARRGAISGCPLSSLAHATESSQHKFGRHEYALWSCGLTAYLRNQNLDGFAADFFVGLAHGR